MYEKFQYVGDSSASGFHICLNYDNSDVLEILIYQNSGTPQFQYMEH